MDCGASCLAGARSTWGLTLEEPPPHPCCSLATFPSSCCFTTQSFALQGADPGRREAGSGNSGRGVSGGAGVELIEWTPLRLVALQEEAAGGLPVAVSAVLGHRGTRPSFLNRPWRGKCRLDFPILCLAAVNFPFNNPPDRIGGDGKKLERDGPGPLHVGGGSVVAGFALLESASPQTAACG